MLTRVKRRRLLGALLALLPILIAPAVLQADDCPPKGLSRTDLVNPLLGPTFAQWLVGPVACLASQRDVETFLALTDDAAAERFVTDFWGRHQAVREAFEQRAKEADKRFREGTHVGHRTDRGTIFVIYGEPEDIFYEEYRDVAGPDIEHWKYEKSATPGLDGRKPKRDYRFAKRDDVTVFFREDPRRVRRRTLPTGPPGVPNG